MLLGDIFEVGCFDVLRPLCVGKIAPIVIVVSHSKQDVDHLDRFSYMHHRAPASSACHSSFKLLPSFRFEAHATSTPIDTKPIKTPRPPSQVTQYTQRNT